MKIKVYGALVTSTDSLADLRTGTVAPTPWLDGKHVVFGEVTSGMDVVSTLEALGSAEGTTSKKVTISACGLL